MIGHLLLLAFYLSGAVAIWLLAGGMLDARWRRWRIPAALLWPAAFWALAIVAILAAIDAAVDAAIEQAFGPSEGDDA